MAGEREFTDRIMGRRWDNFPQRVAATYYLTHHLHDLDNPFDAKVKEKLLRLISKEDLGKVVKAYGKR